MSDAGVRSTSSFDLTRAADAHYRGMVRIPRWVGLGFLAYFCAIALWLLLTVGFNLLFVIPIVAGIAVLAWIVLFYAIPGPITLRDVGASVEFVYPRGNVRRIGFNGNRLRLRLLERASQGHHEQAGWTLKRETDYLAIIGSARIALTREAYLFLDGKATGAGFEPVASVSPSHQVPRWHIRAYVRVAPH